MKDRIENALLITEGLSIKEFMLKNNIEVYSTTELNDKEDACLCGNKILVRKHLPRNYRKFVIWHEIGHYSMHTEDALLFSFSHLGHRNKLEVEANIFACMKLLEYEELDGVNVIDLLKHKGVPERIAIQFYEKRRIWK